jgi:hypothetical protein
MPFDISAFQSQLNISGVAKTSNYEVRVFGPDSDVSSQRDLTYRCASVNIPGRRVLTTEITDFSLPRFAGYSSSVSDVNMTIILSEDLREKIYFEKWLDKITGNYRVQTSDTMFDLAFYDDYAKGSTMEIYQFNDNGEQTRIHSLLELFPYDISDITTAWDDNSIMYLDVSFKYRFYRN